MHHGGNQFDFDGGHEMLFEKPEAEEKGEDRNKNSVLALKLFRRIFDALTIRLLLF